MYSVTPSTGNNKLVPTLLIIIIGKVLNIRYEFVVEVKYVYR